MLNKEAEVSVAQLEVCLLGLCKTLGVNLQQYCMCAYVCIDLILRHDPCNI